MHKKIQYILLLMLFTCLIPVTAKNKSRISLNDEWQFKQSISQSWLPAQVPGAVHTDLMNNRMIKDPFYGVNEKSCLLYTSPSPRDPKTSRMPSSA